MSTKANNVIVFYMLNLSNLFTFYFYQSEIKFLKFEIFSLNVYQLYYLYIHYHYSIISNL